MEKRDMAILLLALVVVVVMAVVVKPILTGKSPDLSLPSLPGSSPEPTSPSAGPQEATLPRTAVQTPTPTPTWSGTSKSLGYVAVGTPTPTRTGNGTSMGPGNVPAGTPPTPTLTPGPLTASFNATPREGPVPLTVQFTDTSIGVPDGWAWLFGDGTTSSLQNPHHTYTRGGSYQVSLTVQNALGGQTRISQGYITVTSAEERNVVVEAQRGAFLSPGGFIECTVKAPGSRIKIGGRVIDLPPGTHIRLVVDDQGKGKISIRDGSILLFWFDQVILYIDGSLKERGTVQEITVQGYDEFISSLNLNVAGGAGDIRILENGFPVSLTDEKSPFSLISLRPDPYGVMTLDCYWPDSTFFQGAVTSYHLS